MRPLVLRVHIYMPGKGGKRSLHSAVAHLKYMGNPKKEELVRDDEAMREQGLDEAAVHARYAAHRPGSTGMFGAERDRPLNEGQVLQTIRYHKGPVWRIITSVHADDVRAMGGQLYHRAAWEHALRTVLPKMADDMGIPPDALRWAAAMHRKVGPEVVAAGKTPTCHVHILLWSEDPEKGYLNRKGIDAARRAWTSELYAPAREALGKEKSDLRQEIAGRSRLMLGQGSAEDLGARLAAIAAELPGKGRLAYAYMPTAIKAKLDATADWLLAQPELRSQAARYGAIAAELASHYSYDPQKHEQARENAMQDLRQRLAGGVLRAAVGYDDRLAWKSIQEDVWRATRGEGEAPKPLADPVREAVSRLASAPSRAAALAEARVLLNGPLQEAKEELTARAERRGKPDDAADRARRAQERLEAAIARRLERSAEYVRDARAYQARQAASGLMMALQSTLRDAEREALRAVAREAEEEAERKRQAARDAERAM